MSAAATFRPARKSDASDLAVLVDIAGEGFACHLWQGLKQPGESALEFGRSRAMREQGGFSYRNSTIAEVDGEVAGVLIGYLQEDPYPVGDLSEVAEEIRPLILLEAEAPGSWYVNVLAVFPEFHRHGLGAALLKIADDFAAKSGADELSVIVGSWNKPAASLYLRQGYQPRKSLPGVAYGDFPHDGDWVVMVKQICRQAALSE